MHRRNIFFNDINQGLILPPHRINNDILVTVDLYEPRSRSPSRHHRSKIYTSRSPSPMSEISSDFSLPKNYTSRSPSPVKRRHHHNRSKSISPIRHCHNNRSRSISPIRNFPVRRCNPKPRTKHICTDNMCRGEKKCYKILINLCGITDVCYKYRINSDNMKSYDFYFVYDNKKYLLEWDGPSHFITDDCFEFRKNIHDQRFRDIMYTNTALLNGYRIIRIDYTQIDYIKHHIELSLKIGHRYYFSDECLYEYIIRAITKR